MRTIDTHLHVWDLKRLHYHWLTPDDSLYRDVMPDEVYPQMQAAGVDAAVLVEAANRTAEIPFLLELAERHRWIAGVVGWMSADDQISAAPHPLLRGVRIPAVTPEAALPVPEAVTVYGLTCDLLVNPDGYGHAYRMIAGHPSTTFVLDHFAGAVLSLDGETYWMEQLRPLAELPNAVMKLSGHLTAAEPKPLTLDTLRRYVDGAVSLFGAGRLLYGSNYPICTQAGTYEQDISLMREAIAHLDADDQAQILGSTAVRTYGLETA